MILSKEKYIPGFDWFRIIGSILVAAAHQGFFVLYYEQFPRAYRVLSTGVPVFFIMSGYLSGREYSVERLIRQILRYGIPYLVIEFTMEVVHFSKLYFETGEAHYLGFLANLARCFVLDNNELGFTGPLWFILALVYALLLNALVAPKYRKILIVSLLTLCTIVTFIGEETVLAGAAHVLELFPLLGRVFHAEELPRILNRFLTGALFTTIGFDIASWKLKPICYFIIGVLFGIFEISVCYLNLAVVFLSIALFFGIRALPGQVLRPFHMDISLFSVLMFFLHILEGQMIYQYCTENAQLCFLLILAINLLLAVLITSIIRIRQSRTPKTVRAV